MRRRNLFSVEQKQEIYSKYLSGEPQHALSSEYDVSKSVISRIIQKHSAVDSKFNCPSGTASSFPADSANDQALYPPHIYPNEMGNLKAGSFLLYSVA